jgi:phage/plasmid-associated DNA primase
MSIEFGRIYEHDQKKLRWLHQWGKMHSNWNTTKSMLVDQEFFDKLNSDGTLFPCKGGMVIDFNKRVVRKRTKTDMFSFEGPAKYLEKENVDPADEIKVEHYFNTMVKGSTEDSNQREEMKKYFIWFLSTLLTGRQMKMFAIWWGERASNGKTELINFLTKNILGLFAKPIRKSALICRDNHGNIMDNHVHNSHQLPLLPPSRMVYCSETQEGDILNDSINKQVSGGDTMSYRGSGARDEEQKTFISQAKLIYLTQHMLRFNTTDPAVMDRILVFILNTRFTDKPKQWYEHQADTHAIAKLPVDVFFTMLANRALEWAKDDFKLPTKPQVVIDATQTAVENNTLPVYQFVEEYIIEDEYGEVSGNQMLLKFRAVTRTSREKMSDAVFYTLLKKILPSKGGEQINPKGKATIYRGIKMKANYSNDFFNRF